jgi:FkbM family methyltransferase
MVMAINEKYSKDNGDIITKEFNGKKFYFYNTPTIQALINEIFADNYDVFKSKMTFSPGDVILDLGACEGVFSILMAKTFPLVRIISLEPVPSTFAVMIRNIGLNGVTNITPTNLGVGKSTGPSIIFTDPNNSGGSTSWNTFIEGVQERTPVSLITFDDIFPMFKLEKIKLLKMDIEGAEYETLYTAKRLSDCENLVAEFHINSRLEYQSRRVDGLISWVSNRTRVVHVDVCKMCE